MTAVLPVGDISSYLDASGWERRPERWRGAAIWVHAGDHEVLVPARDGMGDGERRVRDILRVLSAVEGRPPEAIAEDIAAPADDVQWYRTADRGLTSVLATLEGAKDVLGAAARAAVAGPRAVFDGAPPREVRDLIESVRIGPPGELLTLRVPLGTAEPAPLGRRLLLLLQDAVAALPGTVAADGGLTGFETAVAAGVSANLCEALAKVGAAGDARPLEMGVRWARALPAPVPPRTIVLAPAEVAALRTVGNRIRRLRFSGEASVTGVIGALFDNGRNDRFRVQVRGEMRTEHASRPRHALWARLTGDDYRLALAAHRDGRRVEARGTLATVNGRLELVTGPGDFRQLP
ncbi:hypothetical protein [Actinomadura parmotrematis]|uniref:Uncharacterized protein n=1 Tax=Actinomadura parmotrematis TaxID=2864039 RepID=A0ABS7FUH0_9ACTN|nr:hypothetical protein [Actinomadura parmotrematis]MBW8484055.1 hypothetical protein [Actinomadura parmotrematis]